jgi:predicted transcriptional regulator
LNTPIKTLYTLLGISNKIEDQGTRLLYLKDVWGLDQGTIAELEYLTQPNVSRYMKKARETKSAKDLILDFTAEELKFVQSLPREIITDMQLISFYTHILKLKISHPFFLNLSDESLKISALASLGIMNKHLENMFGKSQAAVSMIIKRTSERSAKVQRSMRFDTASVVYKIEKIIPENKLLPVDKNKKFTLAGGQ